MPRSFRRCWIRSARMPLSIITPVRVQAQQSVDTEIAFYSWRDTTTLDGDVYLLDVESGEIRRLTTGLLKGLVNETARNAKPRITGNVYRKYYFEMDWSPDGRYLAIAFRADLYRKEGDKS